MEVEAKGIGESHAGAKFDHVEYHVTVNAEASEEDILELMRHTDTVAEMHNTLRASVAVEMGKFKAISS